MSDSSSRPPRSSSRAPTRPLLSEEEAARLQDAHLAHLAELHETGHLLVAGPLRDLGGELRGLSLLGVDVERARALKRRIRRCRRASSACA